MTFLNKQYFLEPKFLIFTVRIGMLYVMSGFGGGVLSAFFIQSRISVGASGALFGFLGGMLSELITNWTIYANKVIFDPWHLIGRSDIRLLQQYRSSIR